MKDEGTSKSCFVFQSMDRFTVWHFIIWGIRSISFVGIGRRGEYCTKRVAFGKLPDSEIDLRRDCLGTFGTFVDIRYNIVDSNVMGG